MKRIAALGLVTVINSVFCLHAFAADAPAAPGTIVLQPRTDVRIDNGPRPTLLKGGVEEKTNIPFQQTTPKQPLSGSLQSGANAGQPLNPTLAPLWPLHGNVDASPWTMPAIPTVQSGSWGVKPVPPVQSGSWGVKPIPPVQSGSWGVKPIPPVQSGSWGVKPIPPVQSGSWGVKPIPPVQSGSWGVKPVPQIQYGPWGVKAIPSIHVAPMGL